MGVGINLAWRRCTVTGINLQKGTKYPEIAFIGLWSMFLRYYLFIQCPIPSRSNHVLWAPVFNVFKFLKGSSNWQDAAFEQLRSPNYMLANHKNDTRHTEVHRVNGIHFIANKSTGKADVKIFVIKIVKFISKFAVKNTDFHYAASANPSVCIFVLHSHNQGTDNCSEVHVWHHSGV